VTGVIKDCTIHATRNDANAQNTYGFEGGSGADGHIIIDNCNIHVAQSGAGAGTYVGVRQAASGVVQLSDCTIHVESSGGTDYSVQSTATVHLRHTYFDSSTVNGTGVITAADAIWDEPLAAHTTADTPGNVVNMLTQDSVDLTSPSVDIHTASIFGQLLDSGGDWAFDRSDDSLRAISESGGGGPTAEQIADAVWDEDIVAAHSTASTAGLILSQLTERATDLTSPSIAVHTQSVLGQMMDSGGAWGFDRTDDSLQAISEGAAGGGATAKEVWEYDISGVDTAGSAGTYLVNVSSKTDNLKFGPNSNVQANVVTVASNATAATNLAATYDDRNIVHVSKQGNDSNAGTGWGDAFLTLITT
jgi:hypothetical protein